jgi:hypothetical protein
LLISTESIFSTLNTEDITDLSKLPLKERHTVLEPLISRSEEPLSLLCLALDETTADIRDVAMQQQTNRGQEILVRVIKKGVERAQEEVQQLLQKASQTPAYNSAARQFHSFTDKHERPVRIGLFLMGI